MAAFFPGPTVSLSVSNSTASVSLGTQARTVRVYNATTVTVFVKFGIDSATATTSDTPFPPGWAEAVDTRKANYAAAITASGSGTVYFTVGEGE